MDVRELRSVAMSIILKQRVCRKIPKPSSFRNKQQETQTYPPINHNRHQPYQYKEIDVSVFDALFEGKPIENIQTIIPSQNSSTTSTKKFKSNSRYRYVIDKDFFKNCRKPVSQLILYWETVWLVGKATAGRCAGWDW
ncbi:1423_t:CDS:1 [Funneliformis geosporum]|uniref:15066_t:CDS:1 n=1 Tax=Funneliformis geosporum TaxID=1117311 RepID=A0A9W4SH52_9GLOM|nr:15066_t:CDS:1 [Funneliformis geosporum]CAI2183331.1 1423_t:CDS:1 [Funneliformis geosporum]